jgi:hypothetical protein
MFGRANHQCRSVKISVPYLPWNASRWPTGVVFQTPSDAFCATKEVAAMKVASICWYLCGLFVVGLLISSAISVHPSVETAMTILMGVEAGLCVLFGVLAAVLKHLKLAEPPWVVRVFQGLAVLATILVVLLAGG